MTGRANAAEASSRTIAECQVDRVEDRSGTRGRGVPRPLAFYGIGVESPAALLGDGANLLDVREIVHQRQLVLRRMSRLDVMDA